LQLTACALLIDPKAERACLSIPAVMHKPIACTFNQELVDGSGQYQGQTKFQFPRISKKILRRISALDGPKLDMVAASNPIRTRLGWTMVFPITLVLPINISDTIKKNDPQ